MSGLLSQMEKPQAQLLAEQVAAAAEVEAAAAASELQATRRMLREQARMGRLKSVTNIFMAALLDTEFSSTQGVAPCASAAHPPTRAALLTAACNSAVRRIDPCSPDPTLPGTETQLAVLHGMAFAASTNAGAATFGVGVLETVFGLSYSAEVRVRLQATQLLLKLASAARAGVGAAQGVLGFLWSHEALRGLSTILAAANANPEASAQQPVLNCALRLLLELLAANVDQLLSAEERRDRLAMLELGAQLDRIEHASRAHAWRAECEADTTTDADARETFGLLAELRPILAAAEGAIASPEAKQELDRSGITWARVRKSMSRDKL